jgi:hypothetical protein
MNHLNDSQRKRSLAEAHLFVAVAKADMEISVEEILVAVYQAKKSQNKLDWLNANSTIRKFIKDDIHEIFNNSVYSSWNSSKHVEEAIKILKQVKNDGNWAVKLTADKLEDGLKELAFVDGYNLKESQLIKEIIRRLKE